MHVTELFYSSFLMLTCVLFVLLTNFYTFFVLFFSSNFGGFLC